MSEQPNAGEQPRPLEGWPELPTLHPSTKAGRVQGLVNRGTLIYLVIGGIVAFLIGLTAIFFLYRMGIQAGDLEKLQGAWVVSNEDFENADQGNMLLRFKDDKLIAALRTQEDGKIVLKKEEEWGTFVLDPNANPRHLDLTLSSGPNKGKVVLGIYALENDRLTLCLGIPGKDRPTDFRRQPGVGVLIRMARLSSN
jgi:uncharacterized protein (TIGR03067 family)